LFERRSYEQQHSTLQSLGTGLAVIGFVLLLGYGLYSFFSDYSSPILKVSIGAIVAGVVLVLLTLIKEKVSVKDKETERKY
jgi:multisubunit Na+/H+ antiporter MnhB subunit